MFSDKRFILAAVFVALTWTAPAMAQTAANAAAESQAATVDFDISAQSLSAALVEFGQQSGQELLYSGEAVAGKSGNAVQGNMSRRDAMALLLQGTGLEFDMTPSGGMIVGDRATLDARRAEWESSAAAAATTIGQRRPGIEEIIVTGQKREERIQDVPIAISAFSPEDLHAQKIEGGFDLLKGVPNVTFSKTNFSGYNFQIRGIGTQAVSATTDPGVAVSFNNTTLIVNRLFEQEYLDVERVEVLRGPQGTLYGRNATGGVINVISAKPELGVTEGELKLEVGNFNARRVRGMFNLPLGDTFAIRGAYASTQRDGFGFNEASETNDTRTFGEKVRPDVDGRDLWTGRLTLGWQPTDMVRFNLLWERFREEDNRVRTSKQLCHRDTGPGFVQPTDRPVEELVEEFQTDENRVLDVTHFINSNLSQACKGGSLYDDAAFGTPNGASLPYVSAHFHPTNLASSLARGNFARGSYGLGPNPWNHSNPEEPAPCQFMAEQGPMFPVDLCNPDVYGGRTQSRDLRSIYSEIEPIYRAEADIFELSFDLDFGNAVFSSQTVYLEDEYMAAQDFNRFASDAIWTNSTLACGSRTEIIDTFIGPIEVENPVCDGDPDDGFGTFRPLTDLDGDGIVDQTRSPLNDDPRRQQSGEYTVDAEGNLRDEDGRQVGFYRDLTPDGILCDPQLGCSDSLVAQDLARSSTKQFSQEFRLVSNYDGNFNYSLGANYTRFETNVDYFVFVNGLTHLLNFFPFDENFSPCAEEGRFCRYVDPTPLDGIVNGRGGDGHNYFRSDNPYELRSAAIFGETYWNVTDTLKLTTGLRLTWDKKTFSPIPSQLLLADYREFDDTQPGDGPGNCNDRASGVASAIINCALQGTGVGGRGSPADPDIIQEWREPTGRIVLDWSPDFDLSWLEESMFYGSISRGYKGGGANPPSVAPPARFFFDAASGGTPDRFEAEFVNAYEIGTKNTLFDGAATFNAGAFYYDYTDYQVSRIVDRRAVNDNFDAKVWGLELESVFAPSLDWQFNAAIGYLRTRIADGEESIDIMDRADGGNRHYVNPDWTDLADGSGTLRGREIDCDNLSPGDTDSASLACAFPNGFDEWVVVQPWITSSANCVVPRGLIEATFIADTDLAATDVIGSGSGFFAQGGRWTAYCQPFGVIGQPVRSAWFDADGNVVGNKTVGGGNTGVWLPNLGDAPNFGAGFAKDLGGNELPNSPRWTVSLGGQYSFDLTRDWRATARVDYYWQDESYARVYNFEPYDRLKSWSNTNLSFWVNNPQWGVTVEAYVKNAFDETPITGAFLNAEDAGLTTNVFTLDPRLIGVSLRKEF